MRLQSADVMNYEELCEKYLALVAENRSLKEENEILKAKLGISEKERVDLYPDSQHLPSSELDTPEIDLQPVFSTYADPLEKIGLFRSLFRGRHDVYAKRWENRDGRSGYSPVCLNEWKSNLCRKPAGKCSQCPHQLYERLDEKIIEAHLRGSIVIGVYPLYQDETCHFLAIDLITMVGKMIHPHSETCVCPSISRWRWSVRVRETALTPGFSLKTRFPPA